MATKLGWEGWIGLNHDAVKHLHCVEATKYEDQRERERGTEILVCKEKRKIIMFGGLSN